MFTCWLKLQGELPGPPRLDGRAQAFGAAAAATDTVDTGERRQQARVGGRRLQRGRVRKALRSALQVPEGVPSLHHHKVVTGTNKKCHVHTIEFAEMLLSELEDF